MKYKILTLSQPYASLVALGAKRIETRSWRTSYRGPLAIHAAKGLGPVGGQTACSNSALANRSGQRSTRSSSTSPTTTPPSC